MKLIVQVPCYNEEETLPVTVGDVPRHIPGIDRVEVLVVDDGSTDRTVGVARQCGVDHIVRLAGNKGLATAFKVGLDEALKRGADVVVNTDGDNQYCGADIPALVQPILRGEADMVIGSRPIETIEHFSFVKKKLQRLGSWVIRQVSGTDVPDATSGFRAFSRDAAFRLNVVSRFSYTLETIIQAGSRGISIRSVPVRTNEKLRESRLFKSTWSYIVNSTATMVRIYAMYKPLRVFSYLALGLFALGGVIGVRFMYYFLFTASRGEGHVQSLILAAILIIIGFQTLVTGLLSDIISSSRRLIEEELYHVRLHTFGVLPGTCREAGSGAGGSQALSEEPAEEGGEEETSPPA
ncbi:MAG: glycosyltransferase family 2 protein [Candidatus Brocadiia bacterium]